ncbi:hypothetical protein PSHT_10169 [Puccinia striiformis]|uniref:Uncharacterized protein n=2 Tax=Puccinia striiformis TaxID=27350 RepID=A0A2S4V1G2_9BASI|nr:hypothetical protein PSTT_11198 [Puccinia striiformis]POW06890.1 hypothetical protein PSHT_10169 [Puccinia striiformis]
MWVGVLIISLRPRKPTKVFTFITLPPPSFSDPASLENGLIQLTHLTGNSRWEIDPTTLISAAKLMVETCLKSITHSNPEIMQSPELQAIMAGFEASLEQIKSQLVTQMNQNHSNLTNRVNLHHAQASNNYANTTRQITTIQTQVQEMNACIQRIDRLL